MATVSLTVPAYLNARKRTPKMVIAQEYGGVSFTAPLSPQEVSVSGLGNDWASVARSGVKPLLPFASEKLMTLSFDLRIVNPKKPDEDQAPKIKLIEKMAQTKYRIKISYGAWYVGGFWRLTNMTVQTNRVSPIDNKTVDATVSLEFIRASDIEWLRGPVSGGVKPPASKVTTAPKKPTTTPTVKKKAPTVRTYKVRKGDTLSGIAVKIYHNANKWRDIASLNKLANPNKIYPNQVLKLP